MLDKLRAEMDMKVIFSTLWIFFLLNMVFRDIHELFRPGFLAQALTGTVNGNEVTEGLLLMGGFLVEISILMVVLFRLLNYRANRWVNIVAGLVAIGMVFMNNTAPDLDDLFFAAVELIALGFIVGLAWKWTDPLAQSH